MLKSTVSGLVPATIRRKIILWCILLLVVPISFLVGCAGPTSTPTPTPPSGLAVFQVTELEVAPAEIIPGEDVLITAKVTNIGDTTGDYTVELKINEVAQVVRAVTMAAGETRVMSFLGSMQVPGAYEVELGELTGQFVVLESAEFVQPRILGSGEPEPDVPSSSGGCSGCGGSSSGGSSSCGCSSGLTDSEPTRGSCCG